MGNSCSEHSRLHLLKYLHSLGELVFCFPKQLKHLRTESWWCSVTFLVLLCEFQKWNTGTFWCLKPASYLDKSSPKAVWSSKYQAAVANNLFAPLIIDRKDDRIGKQIFAWKNERLSKFDKKGDESSSVIQISVGFRNYQSLVHFYSLSEKGMRKGIFCMQNHANSFLDLSRAFSIPGWQLLLLQSAKTQTINQGLNTNSSPTFSIRKF